MSTAEIKKTQILHLIRKKRTCSRSEITVLLGMDKKSVSLAVDDLIKKRLLKSAGFRDSRAGRRQELLSLNGTHSNYIGIDLGATHIIGVRTDLQCEVLDRVYFEIRPGLAVDLILEQMKSILRTLTRSQAGTGDIASIGVAIPGFVNPKEGVSLRAFNIPGWNQIRIGAILGAEISRPVYIEDCSRAMGLAERWLGKGSDVENFLVLDVGYGIGMALFLNGKLYTGSEHKSGEIGHIVVEKDGPVCTCGKQGCLEVYASGRGIARLAAEGVEKARSAILEELIHGNIKSLTAQDVALAASMNDEYSLRILETAGNHIGTALSYMVSILNPERIIIGGSLTGAGKPFTDAIWAALRTHTMKEILADSEMELSDLGVVASARGGALIAMEPLFT